MAHFIKLQQPERPRIRVRDLARDIGVHYSEVLEFLKSTGEYVRSKDTFLEAPCVRKVREHFGVPEVVDESAGWQPWRPPALPQNGLSSPEPRPRRENNPLLHDLTKFSRQQPPGREPLDTPPPRVRLAPPTQVAPIDGTFHSACEPSETWVDLEWRARGLSEVERDVWLAHGLEPRHARIAYYCGQAGIRPTDLATDVDGYTVLYRVTHDEQPRHVRRLLDRSAAEGASS